MFRSGTFGEEKQSFETYTLKLDGAQSSIGELSGSGAVATTLRRRRRGRHRRQLSEAVASEAKVVGGGRLGR